MTTETQPTPAFDPNDFDLLLTDVLHTLANPETPERVRVHVRTRVWVRELAAKPLADLTHGPSPARAVVFSPEAFQSRMNPKRDARSTTMAILLHAAAIALIAWGVTAHVQFAAPPKPALLTELATPPPPISPVKANAMGGGGGQRGPTPVAKGELPKFADLQITPPKAAPMEQPKIRMPDATIEVQKDLKMANSNMSNLGLPTSTLPGFSMGNGRGTGLGTGTGSGLGLGSGGNYGGGVRQIGGGVSKPEILYEVEPEFSEEARKAKTAGNVLVSLIVDTHGMPQNVHVNRGVGMGLDEKAIEAVKQYRFTPGKEGGKPVAVFLNIEVNFQIF